MDITQVPGISMECERYFPPGLSRNSQVSWTGGSESSAMFRIQGCENILKPQIEYWDFLELRGTLIYDSHGVPPDNNGISWKISSIRVLEFRDIKSSRFSFCGCCLRWFGMSWSTYEGDYLFDPLHPSS